MAAIEMYSNVTHLEYTSLFTSAAIAIVSVVGTIGNSLVLYVFGFRFPKSPFNVLITILALFDLLVCFLFMPIDVIFMAVPDLLQFRLQLCRLGYVVMDLSSASSSVLLCDIAYIRSRMICSPLRKQVTLRHANIMIVLATVLGMSIGLISFFAAVEVKMPTESGLILVDCGMGYNDFGNVYVVYYVLMVTLITSSVALMSVFYIRIARSLIRRRRVMPGHETRMLTKITDLNSNEQSSTSFIQEARRRKEAVRRSRTISTVMMMFTVTFCFAITYTPHFITLSLCFVFQAISCNNMAAYPFLFRSGYISNFANFVIYGCFSSEFRRELSLLVL